MRIKTIFAALLVLVLTAPCLAQPKFKVYPDSIRVELPDLNALVVFEMRDYPKSSDYVRNFSQTLRQTLDNIKKGMSAKQDESAPHHIEVNYMPEGTKEIGIGMKPYGEKQLVTIHPIDLPKTTMTILKDRGIVELLPPGWEVVLLAKEYRVSVYASTFVALDSIPSQDFGIVADAVSGDEGMKTLWRKSIESQLIIRNNKVDQRAVNYVFPGDNIGLGFTAGVGLLRNILYPELSFKLWLSFKDRYRRPNHRISLIASQLYFTEQSAQGFTNDMNTFLSGSFEKNFNHKTAQASWSGLGIGFLIKKNGDYFQGNTAKFFITHTIPNSRFSMVPEFYLTDDFKKFTFGMTLKYSF